jgi:hypothetical protein
MATKKKTPEILDLVGTIVIPAMAKRFIVEDNFTHNMGKEFRRMFVGKEEEACGETVLYSNRLSILSTDDSIVERLGGREKVVTRLAHIDYIMSKQPGVLSTKEWNAFYSLDKDGIFRAVGVLWADGGWSVDARSTAFSYKWGVGNLVISPHKERQ